MTHTLYLSPVYGGEPGASDENKLFWKYTPSGEIKFATINHEAAQRFEFGKEYYVDFIPAPADGAG